MASQEYVRSCRRMSCISRTCVAATCPLMSDNRGHMAAIAGHFELFLKKIMSAPVRAPKGHASQLLAFASEHHAGRPSASWWPGLDVYRLDSGLDWVASPGLPGT